MACVYCCIPVQCVYTKLPGTVLFEATPTHRGKWYEAKKDGWLDTARLPTRRCCSTCTLFVTYFCVVSRSQGTARYSILLIVNKVQRQWTVFVCVPFFLGWMIVRGPLVPTTWATAEKWIYQPKIVCIWWSTGNWDLKFGGTIITLTQCCMGQEKSIQKLWHAYSSTRSRRRSTIEVRSTFISAQTVSEWRGSFNLNSSEWQICFEIIQFGCSLILDEVNENKKIYQLLSTCFNTKVVIKPSVPSKRRNTVKT